MGAAASLSVPVEELTDPEEIALYGKLKARYDAESPGLDEEHTEELLHELRYDGWVVGGHHLDHAAIVIGDVVKAKHEGLFYEGLVRCIEGGAVTIDFGEDDIQTIPLEDCRRVLAWAALEVGDKVQVTEAHSELKYVAEVVGVEADEHGAPAYAVVYEGEEEPETGVPYDRLRKIKSHRSTAVRRWREAFHAVVAMHAFQRIFKAEEKKEEEKDDDHDAGLLRDLGVGDVVSCCPPDHVCGHDLWYEGIILELDKAKGRALVHITSEEEAASEGDHDHWCEADAIRKVLDWNVCEPGDRVEAQPRGELLWYPAVVVDVAQDPDSGELEYTVQYATEHDAAHPDDDAEEEVESGLPPAKIRKVQSQRSLAPLQRWKLAAKMISALRAFRAAGMLRQENRLVGKVREAVAEAKGEAKEEKLEKGEK